MYLLRLAAKLGDMAMCFWVNSLHEATNCSCVNGVFQVSSGPSSFFSASFRASLIEIPLVATPRRRIVGAGEGALVVGDGLGC